MQDLHAALVAVKSKDFACYLEGLPAGDKRELKAKFTDAFSESAGKLDSYRSLESGNPSNSLFKAIRIFDLRQITSLPQDIGNYSSVITALNSFGI